MFSFAPIKRRDLWSKIVSGFTNWTGFEKVHRQWPTWMKDCGAVSTVQIAADHDVWRDGAVISRGQSAIKGRDSTHSLNRALLVDWEQITASTVYRRSPEPILRDWIGVTLLDREKPRPTGIACYDFTRKKVFWALFATIGYAFADVDDPKIRRFSEGLKIMFY